MSGKKRPQHLFLRMHPLHRVAVSIGVAAIAYFSFRHQDISTMFLGMIIWIAFSTSYLAIAWILLFTRPVPDIRKNATKDDGSVAFVFIMILLGSFASMFTVLLLMISKNEEIKNHSLYIPVCIGGMMLSWLLVHTVYAFHYAHRYYDNDPNDHSKAAEGLAFPGNEKPDYLDFAYFSFVIGCTFQVSDVEVKSRNIRRIVFLHGLLSFALNTFVVALTINFVGSLVK